MIRLSGTWLCLSGNAYNRSSRSDRTGKGYLKGKASPEEARHVVQRAVTASYGNQIGLATGYVKEIYHPDYVAKRMEIGAVMGAAPRKNVYHVKILIREISSSFWADVPDVTAVAVQPDHPRYIPESLH